MVVWCDVFVFVFHKFCWKYRHNLNKACGPLYILYRKFNQSKGGNYTSRFNQNFITTNKPLSQSRSQLYYSNVISFYWHCCFFSSYSFHVGRYVWQNSSRWLNRFSGDWVQKALWRFRLPKGRSYFNRRPRYCSSRMRSNPNWRMDQRANEGMNNLELYTIKNMLGMVIWDVYYRLWTLILEV